MTTTDFTVKGMTCQHCVKAVTEEVGRLDGVQGVAVDLASGRVTVESDAPVDVEQVRTAVDEAGFELVS